MQSFQNLILLKNLYTLKSIGFEYSDLLTINHPTPDTDIKNIDELKKSISNCYLCDFSKSRKQSMSGYGYINADVMFIDYFVSVTEDDSNRYYSGRSGEMLKAMIENVLNLKVEDVYITHAIKCKPLHQAKSLESQWNSCKNYLFKQIEFIKPKIIIPLGKDAYAKLTSQEDNFQNIRGHVIEYATYKVVPIYHPNHLLRNPDDKVVTFNDLKKIKSLL